MLEKTVGIAWPPKPDDHALLANFSPGVLTSIAWNLLFRATRIWRAANAHLLMPPMPVPVLVFPRITSENVEWPGAHLLLLTPQEPSANLVQLDDGALRTPWLMDDWLRELWLALESVRRDGKGTVRALAEHMSILDRIQATSIKISSWLRSVPVPPVALARTPETLSTAVPRPACTARPTANTALLSTRGPVVRNLNSNSLGFTCSLHAIDPTRNPKVAEGQVVESVSPGSATLQGTIRVASAVADTCFVEVGNGMSAARPWGTNGPRRGTGPAANMAVEFEGISAGHTKTVIIAADMGIPFPSAGTQLRVYTPAVTSPGDSGAALIDPLTDELIGFAFEVTRPMAAMSYSSWVWAATVFDELSVV